jgi:hypothetical protein
MAKVLMDAYALPPEMVRVAGEAMNVSGAAR